MKYKIAAVVVTFNRLELLKQCVESLRNQTYKLDEILIINNSSTDGTLDWLNEQTDLTVITQENSGSAGGQFTGIKTAYEKGYDWIWCFDDDCHAEENTLEKLVSNISNERRILNSLVVSIENNQKLAFGLYDKQNDKIYRTICEVEDEIIRSANFFNGTLFNKDIVKRNGLPIPELFIRGEEYEYYLRIRRSGNEIFTIKSSKVFHPLEKKIIFDNYLFRYEFLMLNKIKRYYFIRNLTFISRKYPQEKIFTLIKIIFFDIIILLLTFNYNSLFSEIRGLKDGLSLSVKNRISLNGITSPL